MIRHAPSIGIGIGISLRGSGVGFNGLANQFPGGAIGLSLRLLNNQFANLGIVNVRRDSDSDTVLVKVDKSFAQPLITLNSPLVGSSATFGDFVSGTDGLVTDWIDQFNIGGNDATQVTTTAQPKIVDAGSLITQGGLPAIDFDTSAKHFDMAALGLGSSWSMFSVIRATGTNSKILSQTPSSGGAPRIDLEQSSPDVVEIVSNSFADSDKMNSSNDINMQSLVTLIDDSTSFTFFTNGSGSNENPLTIGGSFTFTVIAGSSPSIQQELIIYNSVETSNRVGIETNINAHYSIF